MPVKQEAYHFDNCKNFYDETRPDKIEALCKEINKKAHPYSKKELDFKAGGEGRSWYYSLPDFAELLYRPELYRQKVLEEGHKLEESLDAKITSLTEFSSSNALRVFAQSTECAELLSSPGVMEINKALDLDTAAALNALDSSLIALREGKLERIVEDLKKQKNELSKALKKLEKETAYQGFTDLEVDVEYPVEVDNEKKPGERTTKRIDVLLSKPELNRYAIIELKQWTEDNIILTISEDKEELECMVGVIQGKRSQQHPAVKVRDVYKKALTEKLGEDAEIRCFVYLHNQMYNNGQLFKVGKEKGIDILEDCPPPRNILFTKLWYGRMLKRLDTLFRG